MHVTQLSIVLNNYVNDLSSNCTPCSIKLYADDNKLYFTVKTPADKAVLQNCLDRVHNWALKWDLRFSYKKCQYLQLVYTDLNVFYHLENHVIVPFKSLSDLGINVHCSLKPSLHCSAIVNKANIRAKLILKCFLFLNSSNFIQAFLCYLRPLLEYASVVWNPWFVQDITMLENVQRSFTNKVCAACNLPALSYEKRLSLFG